MILGTRELEWAKPFGSGRGAEATDCWRETESRDSRERKAVGREQEDRQRSDDDEDRQR